MKLFTVFGLTLIFFTGILLAQLDPITLEDKEAASGEAPGLPKAGEELASTTKTAVKPQPAATSSRTVSSTTAIAKKKGPEESVRALYLTGCVAGSASWRSQIIAKMKESGLNAVVFDIKDYSGYVSYKMPDVPEVAASGADTRICIKDVESVLKEFHGNGIYLIGRITAFQDPVFAKTHPELALMSSSTGMLWLDNKGLAWLDPAGELSWNYLEAIAKDAFARGFDEINFDYIRFPSDGPLDSINYPFHDKKEGRAAVMERFFAHLRKELEGELISASVFGLTASAFNDLGIGQVLERILPYFDYVSPMVYPSHFYPGSYGFINPAEEPHAVVEKAMSDAHVRREALVAKNPEVPAALFRPWLQAFDLNGTPYDKERIYSQVEGLEEAFFESPKSLNGWMFWDPSNLYLNL